MIDQEILKAQTLKHFPKSLAKKYLLACAVNSQYQEMLGNDGNKSFLEYKRCKWRF